MEYLLKALETARDAASVTTMLDTLTDIAEDAVMRGDSERAAMILALVREYRLRDETRRRVDSIWDDLEITLCPRVISDATARADEITLEELIVDLLIDAV